MDIAMIIASMKILLAVARFLLTVILVCADDIFVVV